MVMSNKEVVALKFFMHFNFPAQQYNICSTFQCRQLAHCCWKCLPVRSLLMIAKGRYSKRNGIQLIV